MNLNDIPTPVTDAHMKLLPYKWDHFDHQTQATMMAMERRLAVARAALESITHDMGASLMIHALCDQTLKLITPPEQ